MRTIFVLFALVFISSTSSAAVTLDQARTTKAQIKDLIISADGVNSIGIGACKVGTNEDGLQDAIDKKEFDNCVVVGVSKASIKNLLKVFNKPIFITGVAVRFTEREMACADCK